MAVLDQLTEQMTEASTKFFDAAVTTNDKAHDKTKGLVTKISDADLGPLSEMLGKVDVPEGVKAKVDELPEPIEAVDTAFELFGKGIEANRNFTMWLINRFASVEEMDESSE